MTFHVPDKWRIRSGRLASDDSFGNNGAFFVPGVRGGPVLAVIASDGDGWEHVSVSTPTRCPTWDEMCRVKALFWDDEDCVLQYHPPKSDYVNFHPFCLHLWRPIGTEILRPPAALVGGAESEAAA